MRYKLPLEYKILADIHLIVAKGVGVVTGEDVLNHLDELSSDEQYTAPMKKLIDYRTIESINISPMEANKIADRKITHQHVFHGEKCAIVSPEDLTFGTSRVHQALVENSDINTKVFRQFEDALIWLDVSEDELNSG